VVFFIKISYLKIKDLVPKQNAQAWLKYLRGQYPTVAFKSSTQGQKDKLSQSSVSLFFYLQHKQI